MFNTTETRLQRRTSGTRAVLMAIAATLTVVSAGTFAVSAQTPARQQDQTEAQPAAQPVQGELRTTTSEQASPPRRQVRVIPLFNTPANPTGFATK